MSDTQEAKNSAPSGNKEIKRQTSSYLPEIRGVYTTESNKKDISFSDSDEEFDLEEARTKGVLVIKRYIRRHEPILEEYLGRRCCCCDYSHAAYSQAVVRSLIKGFFTLIFHWLFLIVLILSVGATVACDYLGLYTDVPLSLLASALLFPISFGINWTFNRRENLLKDIAELKATCLAIYYLFRDWQNPDSTLDLKVRKEMWKMLVNIGRFMMHKGTTIHEIYNSFDKLAWFIEDLRKEADWIRSVAARLYQYHRYLIVLFERIRVVHDYRTPSTLRSFGLVFLTIFPILFAPFFANYSHNYGLWAGIFTSVISAVLLVGLHGIQIDCEDPCDKTGIDDLHMSVLLEPVIYMTRSKESFERRTSLPTITVLRNVEDVQTDLSKEEPSSFEEEEEEEEEKEDEYSNSSQNEHEWTERRKRNKNEQQRKERIDQGHQQKKDIKQKTKNPTETNTNKVGVKETKQLKMKNNQEMKQ